MRAIATMLLIAGVFTVSAHAVDWPTFHLKTTHTGFNRAEKTIDHSNVKFLSQQWVGVAGNTIDFSSPAVVGNSVYLGSTDGFLYVFDAGGCGSDTCNAMWVGKAGGQIYSSPAVSKGIVYVGSNNHARGLRCERMPASILQSYMDGQCGRSHSCIVSSSDEWSGVCRQLRQ